MCFQEVGLNKGFEQSSSNTCIDLLNIYKYPKVLLRLHFLNNCILYLFYLITSWPASCRLASWTCRNLLLQQPVAVYCSTSTHLSFYSERRLYFWSSDTAVWHFISPLKVTVVMKKGQARWHGVEMLILYLAFSLYIFFPKPTFLSFSSHLPILFPFFFAQTFLHFSFFHSFSLSLVPPSQQTEIKKHLIWPFWEMLFGSIFNFRLHFAF